MSEYNDADYEADPVTWDYVMPSTTLTTIYIPVDEYYGTEDSFLDSYAVRLLLVVCIIALIAVLARRSMKGV